MSNSNANLHAVSTSPGVGDTPPILEKIVRNIADLSKGEGEGIAQKCSCGSVWCPSCFVRKHAPKHSEELRSFDWRRTREVVLTVDRKLFPGGRSAWESVTKNRLIPGFIRNLERGKKVRDGKGGWVVLHKPVKVTDWKWFLEFHEDSFPHWHLFIEVEQEGRAGMIGGDMLRHYWPYAEWVREEFVRSEIHWKNKAGYFQKNGYFSKNKRHQTRLPEWAMDCVGLKIRRSGSCPKSHREKEDRQREKREPRVLGGVAIDPDTGEVHEPMGAEKLVSYRVRLDSCGECTRVRVYSRNSYVEGISHVPYRIFVKVVGGEYVPGQGHCFVLSERLLHDLFELMGSVQVKRGGLPEVLNHFRRTELRGF